MIRDVVCMSATTLAAVPRLDHNQLLVVILGLGAVLIWGASGKSRDIASVVVVLVIAAFVLLRLTQTGVAGGA